MMPHLPPAAAAKFAKVCGLLGSDHDGERSTAAYQATKILRANGMTWADIVAPARPAAPPPRSPNYGPPHAAAATAALRCADRLTPWELRFLQDILRRHRLTAKQAAALGEIIQKLRMAGAA